MELELLPQINSVGQEIYELSLKQHQLYFRDSFKFVPIALRHMPKCFDVAARKQYFPFEFLKREMLDMVLDWPTEEQFNNGKKMSDAERRDFHIWNEAMKKASPDGKFHVRRQMEHYCVTDVRVMRDCVVIFNKIVADATGLVPTATACTMSSFTNKVFRSQHLPSDQLICTVPEMGYVSKGNTSKEGKSVLDYIELKTGVKIEREVAMGKYMLDGFIERTTKVLDFKLLNHVPVGTTLALEYNGCAFHGCLECAAPNDRLGPGRHLNSWLLNRTNERARNLQEVHNVTVVQIPSCKIEEIRKNNTDFDNFMKRYGHVGQLCPRKALKGGRVEAFA